MGFTVVQDGNSNVKATSNHSKEGRLQFHWIIKLWSALLLFTFSGIHWL